MLIKEMRIKISMTQEELAEKLNVGQSSVALWETGKNYPTVKKLLQIDEIFNCTLDDLVSKDIKKTVKMDWGDKPASKTTREIAEQAQREASAPAQIHTAAANKNADILDYVNSSASVENMSLADIKRAAFKAQEEKNGPKHATELSKADTASKLSSLGKNERNMKMAAISSFRAQKEAQRAPTAVERGAYALDSMLKKGTGAALILAQGTADSIHDSIENADNEEYQKAKRRRETLESRLADSTIGINQDEGILAPGGEAVTTQDIIRAGIENAKEQEERHKIQTVIDDDSPGMKLYESGIKSEEKAMEGLSDTAKQVFGIGLSIADNALTLPTAMINPALPLAIMSVKAAGGKAYPQSQRRGLGGDNTPQLLRP